MESDTKEGDLVLLKQKLLSKMTPHSHRVVSKAESSVTVQSPNGAQYRRNLSHLKIFHEPCHHDKKRKKGKLDEAMAQNQRDSEIVTPHEESSTQMIQPDNKIDITSDSDTAQDEVTFQS